MLYRNDIIRGEMAAQEITVEGLAAELNINPNTVSAIRKGGEVRLTNLFKVADKLNIPRPSLFQPKTGKKTAVASTTAQPKIDFPLFQDNESVNISTDSR